MTLTLDTAALCAEEFLRSVPPYPEKRFEGRGIVICAGGIRYGTCVWVLVRILRQLGCRLPIEVWYLGEEEGDRAWIELLQPLGVRCVDARAVQPDNPHPRLGGWESKAHAVLHSRFEEVLFLDADNVPTVDPTFLFDSPEYRRHGTIFWPDGGRMNENHPAWKAFGVPYRDEREVESGQLLIDKHRTWQAINLADWYNRHSDFFYRYVYGDKDTFRFAWRRTETDYFMPRDCASVPRTILQFDPAGEPLFQHRCHAKWSLFKEVRVSGFRHEALCHRFVQELRGLWQPQRHLMRRTTEEDRVTMHELAETDHRLTSVGRNRWPVRLHPDGRIERGASSAYAYWWIEEEELRLAGQDGGTVCRLRPTNGRWEGMRRLQGKKILLRLEPIRASTMRAAV